MAVMYSLFFMVFAAYFQGIETRKIRVRGGSVGGGGGGVGFITYLAIIGLVIMLMAFMFCLLRRFCCGENQEEDDAESKEYENHRNEPTSTEQLDLHMLKLILLAEQAKNISNLHAHGQQHGELSTADVQSEPLKQTGPPQLIVYAHRQTASYDANITEETPMISDIQSGPWEQMGFSQLKLDANRTTTSNVANDREKTQITSYV